MSEDIESNGKITVSRSSCQQGDTVVIEILDKSGATVKAEEAFVLYEKSIALLKRIGEYTGEEPQ